MTDVGQKLALEPVGLLGILAATARCPRSSSRSEPFPRAIHGCAGRQPIPDAVAPCDSGVRWTRCTPIPSEATLRECPPEPTRFPPQRKYLDGHACRVRGPLSVRAAGLHLKRVLARRQVRIFQLTKGSLHPLVGEAGQAIAATDRSFIQKSECRKKGEQRGVAMLYADGLGHVNRMAADVSFRDFHCRRGRGWIHGGTKVRESTAGADPNTAVRVGQEGTRRRNRPR